MPRRSRVTGKFIRGGRKPRKGRRVRGGRGDTFANIINPGSSAGTTSGSTRTSMPQSRPAIRKGMTISEIRAAQGKPPKGRMSDVARDFFKGIGHPGRTLRSLAKADPVTMAEAAYDQYKNFDPEAMSDKAAHIFETNRFTKPVADFVGPAGTFALKRLSRSMGVALKQAGDAALREAKGRAKEKVGAWMKNDIAPAINELWDLDIPNFDGSGTSRPAMGNLRGPAASARRAPRPAPRRDSGERRVSRSAPRRGPRPRPRRPRTRAQQAIYDDPAYVEVLGSGRRRRGVRGGGIAARPYVLPQQLFV